MRHAGASITITSVTNTVAFLLGCTSSLEALSSFCIFAGLGITFLYITSLTIFTPFMVYDISRQMKKKTDCLGFCCCKEKTVFCCRRFFLT